MNKILVVNGPNLNLLGKRQIHIYGKETLDDISLRLNKMLPSSYELKFFQNNIEGEIVNFLNSEFLSYKEKKSEIKGIIINPAAYSHSSIAIRDALEVFFEEGIKIFEVHLSNIFAREKFRHHSYISDLAFAVISGLGTDGYCVALQKILDLNL
jgi:3-dehydroquinate dehydratase-2